MGAGFLTGALLAVLLRLDPNTLTAAATAALAVFAGVQVTREVLETRRRHAATRRRLVGGAWLARRSCEVTLHDGTFQPNPYRLANEFSAAPGLDRLQEHFREVLDLSSELGGDDAEAGRRAFEGFLATADRFGELLTSADPPRFVDLAERALLFLRSAVVDLERFAPRREHEPALPGPEQLKLMKPATAPAVPATKTDETSQSD